MARRSRKTPFVILALVAFTLAATHSLWLRALGAFLVHADSPAHADYAVVLAGDAHGHRILEAAKLVRSGFVAKALVDGPLTYYGMPECDLAVQFAAKKGYPEDYFLKFPMHATSTREEASLVVAELKRLGAKSFLLVTSNYHTRRAGGYFRPILDGLDMRVIAAPDDIFNADSWWRDREGQKTFYLEWSKTVTSWFGI